jgi:lactoylglutathione lyase
MSLTLQAPLEVGVCVRDLDAMSRFYEHALGFARISEATLAAERAALIGFGPVSFRMVRMQTNWGERIKLLQPDPLPDEPGTAAILGRRGIAYLTFLVGDIDAAFARVVAAGAEPISPGPLQSRPGTRLAFFRDPEGNTLELCQYDDLAAYRPDLSAARRP